jgi:hypothetical protein
VLVDVVDYAALLFEGLVQLLFAGMGFLELIAEIFIGLLETLAMTEVVAPGLADDEAEDGAAEICETALSTG